MTVPLPLPRRPNLAVVSNRIEPPDSLDFFPTPPWATRALLLGFPHLFGAANDQHVWEPAAGEGHMVAVLGEVFGQVTASDVHDYGCGFQVGSFVGSGPDVIETPDVTIDWVITNPPFNEATAFVERAREVARHGVAMLVRTSWLEGVGRYQALFRDTPPSLIGQFVERVPMHRGRWDPAGATMTAYAWVIWQHGEFDTRTRWIPPGQRELLTHSSDAARFAGTQAERATRQYAPLPLLGLDLCAN